MTHETSIRLVAFFGVLVLVAFFEIRAPRREPSQSKRRRWTCNLGLVVLGAVLLRLVLPVTAVALALTAAENGWGIFNQVQAPYPVRIASPAGSLRTDFPQLDGADRRLLSIRCGPLFS